MKKFLIASGVAVMAFASIAAAATTFTSNLTVGSTGAEVSALQSLLIESGYSIPAVQSGAAAKGYFGSQTKTAVMAYQAANGVPNTGFVGPLTRGKLNGGSSMTGSTGSTGFVCPIGMTCTVNPGSTGTTGTVSTGGLAGTDGSISDVQELSQYSNEEVGDGESEVKVLGFEVEASNDGDILLKSIKVSFDGDANTGSDNLDDYIESVSVWMGSTKLGSADASAFNEDSNGNYSKTITLKSGTIVRADKTEKFYVSVDGANNIDSSDLTGDAWTVDIENIRFEDGSGVTTTETAYDLDGMDVAINFASFSSAADTELKISTDSSNPESNIVVIDDSNDTDNQVMLVGKLKLEGTSDAVIDSFPVTLTSALGNVTSIANSITLKIGGEEYTETVSSSTVKIAGGDITVTGLTGTVTFDDLDFTLEAGKTVTFTILADINDIEATGFNEGDDLTISVTASNRNVMDVENEEGDQLSDSSEKSGTATGNAQEFRTEGIGLTLVSTATSVTTGTSANDDVGLFTIKYKVTAIGDSIYVSSLATSAGLTYSVDKSGTATTSNSISAAIANVTDTDLTAVGNYLIEDGESETFELTVSVPVGTGGTSGQYRNALTGVKWSTSDTTSLGNTYSSDLDSFKTSYIVLN